MDATLGSYRDLMQGPAREENVQMIVFGGKGFTSVTSVESSDASRRPQRAAAESSAGLRETGAKHMNGATIEEQPNDGSQCRQPGSGFRRAM